MKAILTLLYLSFLFGCSTAVTTPTGQIAVTIKGDVHHSGRYFLPQRASLAEALQQAGGFTDFAYLKKIRITHRDGAAVYCNFRKDANSVVMADGDEVFVDTIKGTF